MRIAEPTGARKSLSASAGDSDVSTLVGLWWASLVMAALALIWMSGLVLARVFRARSDARRELDRVSVRAACLDIVQGSGDATSRLRPFQRRARLMSETLLEFLAIVRGGEREALVSAYRSLNIDDRMRARLSRGSKPGRAAAAEAIAAFPGSETIAALERLVREHCDAEIRIAGVKSLIDLDAPPALRDLLSDMRNRGVGDSLLYLPVVQRITKLDPDQALEVFVDATVDPTARALMAAALGQSGDYRAVLPLCEASADPDRALRISAIRALGILAHPAASDAIIRALDDPEWEVRSVACEAAGRIGLTAALPALVMRLTDAVWWVRFQAADAMTGMGRKGIASLRLATAADLDVVRRAASMALAEKGLTGDVGA